MTSKTLGHHMMLPVLLFTFCVSSVLTAQDDPANYPVAPGVAAASDEGEIALGHSSIRTAGKAELWAAEPMVANAVVFTIDPMGRLYICESYRQDSCVTDNRDHDDVWLDRDLASQTVEDRIAYHKELLPNNGVEYTKHDDLIRVLEDTNGDGKADKQRVFANKFNDLEMGTGAGVLVDGDNVYYTCIPDLWQLRDSNGDGTADVRNSLSTGYGVRVAFRGHDSHGLIVGPDGRLYFSIGDRGYAITTREGKRLHDPSSGAVFRCEKDGSNLEVIATGLRNPQELAFDDYGNLFTGDNNSDSGDKARWVYIAEGGDTGWRMFYQYMNDRGPFNREKIWHPYHAEQPAYIVPPIANVSDGPSGLAYYPGTGLSDDNKGRFFLCDFRGATPVSGIRTFRSKPKGAFFELVDEEQPIWQILGTDLEFGPDGWIYISDWVHGWVGEGKGRIYRFADPQYVNSDKVKEVQSLLRSGLGDTPVFRLVELMNHEDRRIRQMAQFEMVERKLDEELTTLVASESPLLGRLHAIWGIGQRIRSGENNELKNVVAKLLEANTAEVRAQAAKLVGDVKVEFAAASLIGLLSDVELRVRYFAAISLGKYDLPAAVEPLLELLKTNDGEDPAIRHAAIMGLVGQSTSKSFNPANIALMKDSSLEVKRCMAVVLRKKRDDSIGSLLTSDLPKEVLEEVARTIYDVPNPTGLQGLASALGRMETDSEPFIRRALGACNHLGGSENAKRIAEFALKDSTSEKMKIEAINILGSWAKPSPRDRVIGMWRPIGERSADVAVEHFAPAFEKLLTVSKPIREECISAAKTLKMGQAASALEAMFTNKKNDTNTRKSALLALSELDYEALPKLTEQAAADSSSQVRMAAREVAVAKKFEAIELDDFWDGGINSKNMRERQHAFQMLGADNLIGVEHVRARVEKELYRLIAGDVNETERLDLVEAANKWAGKGDVDKLLSNYRATFDQEDPASKYRDTLVGGDGSKGSDIFWNLKSVYCQRCHQVGDGGGAVGPNLSDIGLKKDRIYMLESIVNPNKDIAENFETAVILTVDGDTLTGIVQKETDEYVQLIDVEAKVTTISKDDIEGRRKGQSAMPLDLIENLSDRDIRDLVEWLAGQKKAPIKGKTVIPEGNK